MAQEETFQFHVQVTAKNLWMFSMYHSNKGYLGIFNLLFTLASLYLLVVRWSEVGVFYRLLLLMCVLMFTVWQPGLLFLKAMKQAGNDRLKEPMDMTFTREGFRVVQGEQSMDVDWNQVTKISRIKGEYILYMSSVRAYLVPDQVLGEKKEAFVKFLREMVAKERFKRG